MMGAADLLAEARAIGLEVAGVGGRLRIRPAGTCPPELRARLLEHRDALLAYLRGPGPFAALPPGADPDRPPWGWYFVRSGPLAGCWIGPDGALAAHREHGLRFAQPPVGGERSTEAP